MAGHTFNLKCIIYLYLFWGKKLYCAFIDYKKAFDSVNRSFLWHKLLIHYFDGKLFKIIHSLMEKSLGAPFSSNGRFIKNNQRLEKICFQYWVNLANHNFKSIYSYNFWQYGGTNTVVWIRSHWFLKFWDIRKVVYPILQTHFKC